MHRIGPFVISRRISLLKLGLIFGLSLTKTQQLFILFGASAQE
jgi:hypothetical protein